MTGSELETAVREGAPIVVLAYDNQQFGTIRMHQERDHPGRPLGIRLGPVDFAAYGRALGARGVTVTHNDDLLDVLEAAIRAPLPTVIHLRVDPEQLFVGDDAPAAVAAQAS
jgi:acetolactate synthase-1/2/3 large subunit